MKARVKATGEIVEVHTSDDADFIDRNGRYYWEHELFFGSLDVSSFDDPDYWTRLEHQYAGMAMQSLIMTSTHNFGTSEQIAMWANEYAIALVKELKEEK